MVNVRLHSTGEASSRLALLLRYIQVSFSVVAHRSRGPSLGSVRRRTFTAGCQAAYELIGMAFFSAAMYRSVG